MGKDPFGATSNRHSKPLVNLPAMTDEKQIQTLLLQVEIVDHAIVPDAQTKRIGSLQALVASGRKP